MTDNRELQLPYTESVTLFVADRVPKNTLISLSDISLTCGNFQQEMHSFSRDLLTMFKCVNVQMDLLIGGGAQGSNQPSRGRDKDFTMGSRPT